VKDAHVGPLHNHLVVCVGNQAANVDRRRITHEYPQTLSPARKRTPQLLDDLIRTKLALAPRLQPDDDATDVVSDHATRPLACSRLHSLDIRMLAHDFNHGLYPAFELRKRNAFGGPDVAEDYSRVLPGNEPLGHGAVDENDDHQDGRGSDKHQSAMAHRPTQCCAVKITRRVEHALEELIDASMSMRMPKHQAAHHRGHRERYSAGDQHRHADGHS